MSASNPGLGANDSSDIGPLDLLLALARNIKLLVLVPLAVALIAFGVASVLPKTFTARVLILPPQQQQPGMAAAALANLGALGGLAPGAGAVRTPADQYASLLRSVSITDRLIEAFKLQTRYDAKFKEDSRDEFERRMRVMVGRRDGLITIEVDDESPQLAAEMANRLVEELRRLTGALALTEAQQRRIFFEERVKHTRADLQSAQQALEASGFAAGALRAEPRAAADSYAKLRAEVTATEVRLSALRRAFAEGAEEVQQTAATLAALRVQLNAMEARQPANATDYTSRYRDFKYQETLFEMFSRQLEVARVDEGRETNLIQVVDGAMPPERKSAPKRVLIAALAGIGAGLAMALWIVIATLLWGMSNEPAAARKLSQLRNALLLRG